MQTKHYASCVSWQNKSITLREKLADFEFEFNNISET